VTLIKHFLFPPGPLPPACAVWSSVTVNPARAGIDPAYASLADRTFASIAFWIARTGKARRIDRNVARIIAGMRTRENRRLSSRNAVGISFGKIIRSLSDTASAAFLLSRGIFPWENTRGNIKGARNTARISDSVVSCRNALPLHSRAHRRHGISDRVSLDPSKQRHEKSAIILGGCRGIEGDSSLCQGEDRAVKIGRLPLLSEERFT